MSESKTRQRDPLHWLKPWSNPSDNAASYPSLHSSPSSEASTSRLVSPPSAYASPAAPSSLAPADDSLSPSTLSYLSSDEPASQSSLASNFLSEHTSGPVLGIPLTALGLGFFVGLYTSAQKASLVFMAENAHRRPDTVQGWYFYNKTKNYKVLLAGLRGGGKTGLRMAGWAAGWTVLEQGAGKVRGTEGTEIAKGHWIDGALAGTGIAMVATLRYRLSRPVIPRTLLMGMLAGGTVGALRDVQARLGAKREALAA